ncbi:MAG: S1 RNA-binding domain-containing protein [Chloroflexi bacterium]|nr:S1 RNA-binding domain-containing protein [Chloroflexota bacterium]
MNGEEAAEKQEEPKNQNTGLSMEDLLNMGDLNLDMPKQGEVRTGTIASISDNEILVSIGAKSEGLIPSRELDQMSDEERAGLKLGDDIEVYVVSPESQRGTVLLSYTRSLEEGDWEEAENLLKSKDPYEGTVDGFNKGGLIVRLGRLRGFVPASQVSQARRMRYQGDTPEQRWGEMKGEPLVARVIEVDRERRRLILSERAASQESREAMKDKLLEELGVGETRTGRVTSLADFGAFVNINGADGLVHLSELSWERVDHPSEMLAVGDEVKVKVISVDYDRKRIGLSLRQLQNDPWEDHIHEYKVGQLVEGSVTRLVKFGAFARIDEHIEGLIHISELSEDRIEHPKEVVNEGDTLALRIIKIEAERRRIGLSLRKVDSAEFSDMDFDMALAEIDEDGEPKDDPGAELKEALGLTDEAVDTAEDDDTEAMAEADETPMAEDKPEVELEADEDEFDDDSEDDDTEDDDSEIMAEDEPEAEMDAEAAAAADVEVDDEDDSDDDSEDDTDDSGEESEDDEESDAEMMEAQAEAESED